MPPVPGLCALFAIVGLLVTVQGYGIVSDALSVNDTQKAESGPVPTIPDASNYFSTRDSILQGEDAMRLGHGQILTNKERYVNDLLMAHKRFEFQRSLEGAPFPPALHFFQAKPLIEASPVFHFIRRMPKGGALHIHDLGMTSYDWLIQNATYRPNLYMCVRSQQLSFRFANTLPTSEECLWTSVQDERAAAADSVQFDQWIYNNISMMTDNPGARYPDSQTIWRYFEACFGTLSGLVFYAPVFKDYIYEAMREFRDDNVQYLEIRALLAPVYELDGSEHGKVWILETFRNITRQFIQDYPDVTKSRLIYAELRFKNVSDIAEDVREAIVLREQYPDVLAGFDLVAQEDTGFTLLDYLPALLQLRDSSQLPFFFHAGETDWTGTRIDENLIDAVLLNTTRLGHAYALVKHPRVMEIVKERVIAIEVNPISNQVLGYVKDLRNHPGAYLLANDFPVVISPDDPPIFNTHGLSYDFYEAFMGLAGQYADLRLLKQLAYNSLNFSTLSPDEKQAAIQLWRRKWDTFIDDVIREHSSDMSG